MEKRGDINKDYTPVDSETGDLEDHLTKRASDCAYKRAKAVPTEVPKEEFYKRVKMLEEQSG